MTVVVSNASTLILLAKASVLQIWLEQIDVIIPTEVYDETVLGKESFDARLIKKLVEERKIVVSKVSNDCLKMALREFRMDIGEAAAYALFDTKKHSAIMTDDAELIKLCKLEGINFVCAMAIVTALYQKGILNKQAALEKLKKLSEIGRYSKEIHDYFQSIVEAENGSYSSKA